MKKWPYKKGGLSWEGQFNILDYIDIMDIVDAEPWKHVLVIFFYFCQKF
jgi:hypothetical protein